MSAVTTDEAVLPPSPEPRTPSLSINDNDNDTMPSSRQTSPDRPQTPLPPVDAPHSPISTPNAKHTAILGGDDLDPALKSPTTLNHLRTSLISSQSALTTLQSRLELMSDELAETQSKLHDKENEARFLVAAKDAVEKDLNEERNKRVAAEENVELLRGKLEDARKALTAQGRNAGIGLGNPEAGLMSPGLGLEDDGSGFGAASGSSNPRKSKRASTLFGPAGVGSSQRKVSESTSMGDIALPSPGMPISTSKGGLRELRLGVGSSSVMDSPRSPAVENSTDSGRLSIHSQSGDRDRRPPASPRKTSSYELRARSNSNTLDLSDPIENLSDSPTPPPHGPHSAASSIPIRNTRRPRPTVAERLSSLHSPSEEGSFEAASSPSPNGRGHFITLDPNNDDDNIIDTLRTEVVALKAQLNDAQEARVASEDCLKALRDFIASSNSDGQQNGEEGAVKGIKLPPLPTDRDTEEAEEGLGPTVPPKNQRRDSKKSGWSLAGYWSGTSAAGTGVEGTPTTATGKRESVSHANSLATSVQSEAGDLPTPNEAADHKPPLEPSPVLLSPQIGSGDGKAPSTPLSSFVSSWTKGISVGSTPGVSSPNAPPESGMPVVKRGFSFSGWGKKTDSVASVKQEAAAAAPGLGEEEKEREKEVERDLEREMNGESENEIRRRVSNGSQAGGIVSPVKSLKSLPGQGSAELTVEEDEEGKKDAKEG